MDGWKNLLYTAYPLSTGSMYMQMWDELRDGTETASAAQRYERGQPLTRGDSAPIGKAAAPAVFLVQDDTGTLRDRMVNASV